MKLCLGLGYDPVGQHDPIGAELHDHFPASPGDPMIADGFASLTGVEAKLVFQRRQPEIGDRDGAVAPDPCGLGPLPEARTVIAVEGDPAPARPNPAGEPENHLAPL